MSSNRKMVILFGFYFILGYVQLGFSLVYLNFTETFIIEQGVYSGWNYSIFYFLPFLAIFVFVMFGGEHMFRREYLVVCVIKKSVIRFFFMLGMVVLLASYVNVIISGNLPVFSESHISRFDYLETTIFWPVLQVFGGPIAIVPILLGFVKLHSFLINDKWIYRANTVAFILYIFYTILIGHKFGGQMLGIYFFTLPTLVHKINSGQRLLSAKAILFILVASGLLFLLLTYHYSKLTFTENYGGSSGFIFYRVMALQGHVFWGTVSLLRRVSLDFWWDGMHNIMLIVGNDGVDDAVARNVNFTSGYQAILLMLFPTFLAYAFHAFLSAVLIYFLHIFYLSTYQMSYIVYAYIFLYLVSFYSHGSLRYLLDYKMILLVIILIAIRTVESSLNVRPQ